jgi:multiple antibiotic resistance protein
MPDFETISLAEILTISFTLFAVIDVLGSVPVLLSLQQKIGDIHAGLVTLVAGVLMVLFFFAGQQLLKIMGLDVSSFAIAGSIVIFFLAIEMVLGHEMFRADSGGGGRSGSVVPVAFPIIAGSGTLTTVMSLKSSFDSYNILIGIAINLLIIFVCLRSLRAIERLLGPSGILVVRKFFGVILLAIAIKIFRANVGI